MIKRLTKHGNSLALVIDRGVLDLLIGVAVLKGGLLASGQRNHRAAPKMGILQPRGEVGGTDRLRHAHTRPPSDAGIAVGHVGRRLF